MRNSPSSTCEVLHSKKLLAGTSFERGSSCSSSQTRRRCLQGWSQVVPMTALPCAVCVRLLCAGELLPRLQRLWLPGFSPARPLPGPPQCEATRAPFRGGVEPSSSLSRNHSISLPIPIQLIPLLPTPVRPQFPLLVRLPVQLLGHGLSGIDAQVQVLHMLGDHFFGETTLSHVRRKVTLQVPFTKLLTSNRSYKKSQILLCAVLTQVCNCWADHLPNVSCHVLVHKRHPAKRARSARGLFPSQPPWP